MAFANNKNYYSYYYYLVDKRAEVKTFLKENI